MEANEDGGVKERLLAKGVRIRQPESVEIGSDLDPDRISGERVTIHPGCRIGGPKTLILSGAELGSEGPVTLRNCQLGRDVSLKGGYFEESCFLRGASVGSGAQVREACLLEEKARAAHAVGLKHTILFPFVTLGSLINFCDCLMAGGTGEKNHSEVGSAYIHFNFTPNQDKATPSLIGDVPRGVMLDRAPIFLGGQGGLVGPVRIAYGAVVAAGTIIRKDLFKEDTLLVGSPAVRRRMPFHPGLYAGLRRIIDRNFAYIANLLALRRWYLSARFRFAASHPMEPLLLEGAVDKLNRAISERVKRLKEVADRMPRSIQLLREIGPGASLEKTVERKREFHEQWPRIADLFEDCLNREGDPVQKNAFLSAMERSSRVPGSDYISAVQDLDPAGARAGTAWLQGLVDGISGDAWALLPGFVSK